MPMTDPRRQRRSVAIAVLGGLLGLAAGALVVRELIREWGPASDAIAGASIGWLAAAVVAASIAMVAVGWVWADVLAAFGTSVDRRRVIRWYFLGELGKYLPGGVWTVVGRGELARRGGVPATIAYGSVGLSLVALYVAAAGAVALIIPFDLATQVDDPRVALAAVVVIGGGAALLHPRTLSTLLGLARRFSGRTLVIDMPSGRVTARLVVRYLPAWLAIGFSTWAIARALDPGASLPRVMAAAIVSWIAGFLAVPVPAGGGVREAVFLASAGLGPGVGAAVAIAARLLFVAVDALGALTASAVPGRSMRAPRLGAD